MNKALCISDIERKLHTEYIGRKIFYTETTGSTNDEAKAKAEAGVITHEYAYEGSVFLAENQTNGRGRMFRTWITEPFTSIAMSILIKPDMKPEDAPTITPVLALSTIEAIKKATGLQAQIKWPNDLFINGKKLAGILTEMRADAGNIKYIIAGIGVNINQSNMNDELVDIATSLKIVSGKEFSREEIIAEILNEFEANYRDFLEHGLGYFRENLKKHSSIIGKEVIVISGLELVEGIAEDIDEIGNLILRLDDGRTKRIIYGDVGLKCKEVLK